VSLKRKNGEPRIRLDAEVHPEILKELKRRAREHNKCVGPYLDEELAKLFHVEAILSKIE
jgi:hypothetical protein